MTISLNGRFLSQPVTGVQRYAREIIRRLGQGGRPGGAAAYELLYPSTFSGAVDLPITARPVGRGGGQKWEQLDLPVAVPDALISFCNTGPVILKNHIVCIHDANVYEAPGSYSRAFRTYYKVILPLLGRRARKVVTVSKASADLLVRHGIAPAAKIEVVPNGYEHVLEWDAAKSTLAPKIRKERPFAFVVGSRARHKNLALVEKIAPALDKLGVDVLISGGASHVFRSAGAVEASNVRSLGFVSDDDLAWLYSNALCLLFPSLVEGFGIPLLEAMVHGCPIVSSNSSCMPEICGENAVYASPGDAGEWIARVGDILKNGAPFVPDRSDGIFKRFSWERSAGLFDGLSDQLSK